MDFSKARSEMLTNLLLWFYTADLRKATLTIPAESTAAKAQFDSVPAATEPIPIHHGKRFVLKLGASIFPVLVKF
jgi:hypothetical protein